MEEEVAEAVEAATEVVAADAECNAFAVVVDLALAASCTELDPAERGAGSGLEVDAHVVVAVHEAVVADLAIETVVLVVLHAGLEVCSFRPRQQNSRTKISSF